MTNDQVILKIDQYLQYHFHFTDYDFGGMNDLTGEKAPRPDKIKWLADQYVGLMSGLKEFLKSDPDGESLYSFMTQELEKVNSENYLPQEYRMLIAKYDEIPRWCLGCTAAFDYFKSQEDKLKYCT